LLKQIRNLEGQKMLNSGHNIFVRKNEGNSDNANNNNSSVSSEK
jgi:hypothetical protein